MRLPAGRYRTPLSRASTARRKREPPRREVPEFKRRSRAPKGASVHAILTLRGWRTRRDIFLRAFSFRRMVASVLRIVLSREEFNYFYLSYFAINFFTYLEKFVLNLINFYKMLLKFRMYKIFRLHLLSEYHVYHC